MVSLPLAVGLWHEYKSLVFFFFFNFFNVYLFLREKAQVGVGQREREGDRESKAGSTLSVQSPMRGSNPWIWDHNLSQSRTLNRLSHSGAHCFLRMLLRTDHQGELVIWKDTSCGTADRGELQLTKCHETKPKNEVPGSYGLLLRACVHVLSRTICLYFYT